MPRKKQDLCSTCKYRGPKYGCANGCDFAFLTGKMRGCPGDEHCRRYEKGPKLRPQMLGPVPMTAEAQAEFAVRLYNNDKRRRVWAYNEAIRQREKQKE